MAGDASPAAGYASATDNLRTATRWLLTAAAAAGAVMVAGLQLTSIGALSLSDWPRLVAAGAGLAAALGAIGYMIFRTSRLLTDEWITLAQLQLDQFRRQLRNSSRRRDKRRGDAMERIYGELGDYQDELYGGVADSITDLYSRLQKANSDIRESPSPERLQTAADLRTAANTLVQAANYSYIRDDFAVLRRHLGQAGAVFVIGVVVFAFAANPPKPATAGRAAGNPPSAHFSRLDATTLPKPPAGPVDTSAGPSLSSDPSDDLETAVGQDRAEIVAMRRVAGA
jgi:hypothetical protein